MSLYRHTTCTDNCTHHSVHKRTQEQTENDPKTQRMITTGRTLMDSRSTHLPRAHQSVQGMRTGDEYGCLMARNVLPPHELETSSISFPTYRSLDRSPARRPSPRQCENATLTSWRGYTLFWLIIQVRVRIASKQVTNLSQILHSLRTPPMRGRRTGHDPAKRRRSNVEGPKKEVEAEIK